MFPLLGPGSFGSGPSACRLREAIGRTARSRASLALLGRRTARDDAAACQDEPIAAPFLNSQDAPCPRDKIFEYACATNDVDHRLTKPKHPWTNGQVERMNRTIKDATVNRYFYESHDQLRSHLRDFVSAYNFARRLKTLKGLTPYEFVCKAWTSQPQRFKLNPLQQSPGLNS